MKLFHSLLIAPVTFGILTSVPARATDLNLNDAKIYSQESSIPSFDSIYSSDWSYEAIVDLVKSRGCFGFIPNGNISRFEAASIINSCLSNVAQLSEIEERLVEEFNPELALIKSSEDGIETGMREFEAGSFSDTTVASFSTNLSMGAIDGTDNSKMQAAYSYKMNLSSSFTGDDELNVTIEAGNAAGATDEIGGHKGGDGLVVDGVSYTFPLGDKTTVFVGDNTPGSKLYNTACVYKGPSDTLDDCGNVSSALDAKFGTSAGISFDIGNGFIAALGYEGQGSGAEGLATLQGNDAYGGQLSYAADQFGASITYASIESNDDTIFWALNGYFDPEGRLPSLSIGYEKGNPDTGSNTTSWFAGLSWDDVGPGSFGAGIGTAEPTVEDTDQELMYEAYYSYPITDSMTITPLIYVREQSELNATNETGLMSKLAFKF